MWALLHSHCLHGHAQCEQEKSNYREQRPLLEATSRAADQDLPHFTAHLKFRSSLHYSQPLVTNLSQINPAHAYQPGSCHNCFHSVILATVWTIRISNPYSGKRIFPSPKHPHWPGPLVSEYWGSFPGVSSRGVKLTSVWSRA